MRHAFTMVELVFVIVVIGILTGVAIPKFSAIFQDAYDSKARDTVAAVRSSIANVRQRNLMKGISSYPQMLDDAAANRENEELFDGNATSIMLMYPVYSGNKAGKWMKITNNAGNVITYRYNLRNSKHVDFNYTKATGKFDCDHNDSKCRALVE